MNPDKDRIHLRTGALVVAVLGLSLSLLWAQGTKEFPAHWGTPPGIQTQDYVELPGGYGHGSSTLAKWITAHLEKDKSGAGGTASAESHFTRITLRRQTRASCPMISSR